MKKERADLLPTLLALFEDKGMILAAHQVKQIVPEEFFIFPNGFTQIAIYPEFFFSERREGVF